MRIIIAAAYLLTQVLLADQITLKNGDRITGAIIKYDGKNLVIKSEQSGDVAIPWENVTAVTSTQPLNVTLRDGQKLVGIVTTDGSKFNVATKDAGNITAARETVVGIRSEGEQKSYDTEIERLRRPRLLDVWSGTLDLGYALTHGNTDTSTFSLRSNAVRETPRDKLTVTYTQIYSSSDASGPTLTTANAKRGGIAYNLNIARKAFVFGLVSLENDQFQNLDLRFAPAGGFGYHALNTANTVFDLSGGASMNKEFFSAPAGSPVGTAGVTHTYAEVILSEELSHKFSKTISMHELLACFPNVTSSGNYRMNFDVSAVAAIKKWMSLQISASDRFLSNPLPGNKNNDILFTTGLRFVFAKQAAK
ncbi:MAG TPA: DUF481 domain-containing protein [Bryobacteraceae bacterium]|nr:DUF481 domain-containing protein [Bryobacteraceae bacterium]